jgi:hypothetical protein
MIILLAMDALLLLGTLPSKKNRNDAYEGTEGAHSERTPMMSSGIKG